MSSAPPFQTLGIAPTLDAGAVKRAYFRQLAIHPPHQDPEGFRRLRAAYESLQSPASLATAYLEAPLDLAAVAEPYHQRFDAALEAARRRAASPEQRGRSFSILTASLSYEEAIQRFSPPS
jgi:hypothetical protein